MTFKFREWVKQFGIELPEEKPDCRNKQPCLTEAFFEHQKTLPPSRRSNGAMISCPCPKCNPARL
jgi:hypothetical protein